MIVYDSHNWFAFWRVRGSIFPKAILYGIPSAVFGFCISYFDVFGFQGLEATNNGTIYSGFTFVLGFLLVFRTSAAYNRYWAAATAVHTMRAEWLDACGSLIAFAHSSPRPKEQIYRFSHKVIRLFGLMHAMALEEIATLEDENFPLLDIEGLDKESLRILTTEPAQGRKVEIVCQWIKVYILRHVDNVLTVPAPILTRVFQELGTGLVHYHEALQIVIWPFPFPYAQMSAVLIFVYMVITPVVINLWTDHAWYCALASFISVVCMKGIDVIAMELENPFGDDPNDLPCFQMHHSMNRDLTLLVNPKSWKVPDLVPTAKTTYEELCAVNEDSRLSLEQYYKKQDQQMPSFGEIRSAMGIGNADKSQNQRQWAKENWSRSINRVNRVLQLSAVAGPTRDARSESERGAADDDVQPDIRHCFSTSAKGLRSSLLEEARKRTTMGEPKSTLQEKQSDNAMPWKEFLGQLSLQLREHLDQQLRQQEAVYERHLHAAAEASVERQRLENAKGRSSTSRSTTAQAAQDTSSDMATLPGSVSTTPAHAARPERCPLQLQGLPGLPGLPGLQGLPPQALAAQRAATSNSLLSLDVSPAECSK